MAYIQSYRGQAWLLPPSIEELIPEDHICFMVEGLVESLDYREFDVKYHGCGAAGVSSADIAKAVDNGGIGQSAVIACTGPKCPRERGVYVSFRKA